MYLVVNKQKAKSTIKRFAKILIYFLVVVLSLIISIYLVFRNSEIQTLTAKIAADYLSQELKTEIRISGFDISLVNGLAIEDILVKDKMHQDMFAAHRLFVIPEQFKLFKKILRIKKLLIDQGKFQLVTSKGDSLSNLQFLINYFSSKEKTPKADTTPGKPWKLFVSSIEIRDTHLHFQDENQSKTLKGIDFANIDVAHINLLIKDFYPDGDTLHAKIKHLSAMERSGFALRSMSGEFQVGPGFLKAHQLKLITDHSDLDLDFEFLYKGWVGFSDFLTKVAIHAEINPSYFDLQDVGFFAPELLSMKDRFRIAGDIRGTVSNFKAKNFRIAYGTNTRFWGNISANGLPNVEETFVDLKIRSFYTTISDIESFKLPADAENLKLPMLLRNAGKYNLSGNFTGFYNDFVANAKLQTNIGELTTDLSLRKKKGVRDLSYIGQADVANLHLGQLFKSGETLGNITFRADINGKGFDFNTTDISMNVHVDSVEVNRYNYQDIDIKGSLIDKNFSGLLEINDPNLQLDFNGLIDFSDSLPVFNFTSNVRHAQLFALHLLTRDSIIDLTSRVKVNFIGNDIDNIEGIINIDDTRYLEGKDTATINHLSLLTSKNHQNKKSYHLISDIVDADVTGHFNFREMIPSLDIFISNYLASFRRNDSLISHHPPTDQLMNFKVAFKNTDALAKIFVPFLRVAPNTIFQGFYDETKEMIFLDGHSQDLSVYGTHFSNWFIKATSRQKNLNINTGCEQFILKKADKKDSLDIRIDSLQLVSDIRQDSIFYHFSWVDQVASSEMGGFLSFTKSPAIEIKMNTFNVRLDKKYWSVSKDNFVAIDTSSILIHNLGFRSGNQELKLDGRISKNSLDTLSVNFSNLDISDFDYFLSDPNLNVDGILTGNVKLNNVYSSPILLSDLRIDKLKFNKELLGDANFDLLYDSREKRFDAKAEIIYTGNAGVNIPFLLKGSCYIGGEYPRLDFDLKLKSLNLKMVAPFVSSFMSGVYGFVSGDVKITGRLDRPLLKGKLNMARTEFKINYLNVSYSMADVMTIDSNAFSFNHVAIYDSLGNIAYVTGKLTHNYFSDLAIDLNVELTDFSAFNNTFAQNNLFYGKARGTGNVRIYGPTDNITVDVKASNAGGTHVIIPISLTADVSDNDFIIFETPKKEALITSSKKLKEQTKGFSLNLALLVNPLAELEVFFPDDLGNIKANGQGDITMAMTPTSSFSMTGAYTIHKGTFLFQFKSLMRLVFSISDGSRITWAGDPVDATIALSAVYRTRVSLGGLTTDADKKNLRVPVECVIRLHGKLANPEIAFSLNMPNVDEETKTFVYGAIDTTNTAVMNDQMFNILVLNQFNSPQGAGTSNLNVGSTSISLLTNAFNSMLSKVSKNVAINVNYQRSSTSPGQEIDMGFSTQLFNDRLLIDGLFGVNSMNPNSAAQNASTIVGDINLQYILTDNRRWRARMFNRTNVNNTLDNNAPYTQGIGISYQRDFERWGDLFRKEKKIKKKQ